MLLVISESIRTSDYDDATAPSTTAALPSRFSMREMRSVSSYTALSLSALVTGRSQEAPREAILRAPSLFDYAHAAGYGAGYWSKRSMETSKSPPLTSCDFVRMSAAYTPAGPAPMMATRSGRTDVVLDTDAFFLVDDLGAP